MGVLPTALVMSSRAPCIMGVRRDTTANTVDATSPGRDRTKPEFLSLVRQSAGGRTCIFAAWLLALLLVGACGTTRPAPSGLVRRSEPPPVELSVRTGRFELVANAYVE